MAQPFLMSHRSLTRWHRLASAAVLRDTLANNICSLANECIQQRGTFHVVLAGGNTPKAIYQSLIHSDTDWQRWHIYFGDERCLPPGDPDRNDSMARTAWLDHVAIPAQNIHEIPAHLPASQCITQYCTMLQDIPTFDLVLLGLGEDGHTASLFPDHPLGTEDDAPAILAVDGAPKPPARRMSLSARRLSAAHQVWFIVTGSSKELALQRWQHGGDIPAAAIAPAAGADVYIAP